MTAATIVHIFNDPGHGWAQVPVKIIEQLGIAREISGCSYEDDRFVYLEEDCDLGIFVDAAEKHGMTLQFIRHDTDYDSPIREFRSYSYE